MLKCSMYFVSSLAQTQVHEVELKVEPMAFLISGHSKYIHYLNKLYLEMLISPQATLRIVGAADAC